MKLHTDHHFIIGHSHIGNGKPCQDHALSGTIMPSQDAPQRAYAVISDGCSNGANTDIGSRLITTSTVKAIHTILRYHSKIQPEHPERIYELSGVFAHSAAEFMGIDKLDMLATQLFAVVDQNGKGFVSVYGDGAIAIIDVEGGMTIHSYEWSRNMPFYPHEDRQKFIAHHGGKDALALTQRSLQITPDGEITMDADFVFSVEGGTNGITLFFDVKDNNFDNKTAFVCLFSDGVQQVDKMTMIEAVKALTAFKTLGGDFVKRRLIRFDRDSKRNGTGPVDDLAVAVVAIDHEENEAEDA